MISNNGTDQITLTGTLTNLNNYLNVVTNISYLHPVANTIGTAADSIAVVINDNGNTGTGGGTDIALGTVVVDIAAVNDAPVATIAAAGYNVNEQTSLTLHGTGISINDLDSASGVVEATISVVSGVLTASAGTTGVTVTGSGTNSIVFSGTLAQINDLLAGNLSGTLSYIQNSDTPPATDLLTLFVSDLGNTGSGGTLTDSVNRTINITAVNDTPVVAVPGGQTINVDTVLTLSGASVISVTDVDATTVQITLTASNGGITLSQTTGLTFSTGNGSDDATMIFTGSIADVNAALVGLTFNHGINHGGAATISIAVSDLGGTGIGGALTDSDTISVTINTPGGSPINGDAFLQGNYIQVGFGADGSIGSDFGAPVGYVSAGSQLGVEVDRDQDGWGTYDGDFILPGSPEEGWGVTVNSTDYSNNNVIAQEIAGTLTNQQNTASSQSVDWAGGVGGLAINTTYSVGANDSFIDVQVTLTNTTGLSLNDLYYYRNIDADNNFFLNGNFATINTIVSQGNDGSGVSLVTATQSDGSYVGLMGFGSNSRVTYGGFANRDGAAIFNGTGLNQTGSATTDEAISLAFQVSTLAAGDSTILQYRYYFGHAGSAPVVDLDANNSSGLGGANFTTNFTEGSAPVSIVDSDATLADVDSGNLTGMTVSITNRQDGVAELLAASTAGTSITASFDVNTGVLTLSGSDSVAHYRQVLRTITYENTSQNPDTTVRQISFTATDGTNTSNTALAFVSVTAVNDTPVLATNTTSTVAEGGTDVITNSELLTIDVDNTAIQLSYSVTSAATNGYLELSTNPGVAITNFTQADLNAGLVRYVHDSSNTTTDSFTFTVADGAITIGTYTHNYTITSVNDAPVVVANSLTISESGTVVLTNADLLTTDSDNAAAQLTYTVTGFTGGRFELVANPGVAITSFTQAQVNGGLVQFVHDGNETAPTYSVTVNDGALSDGAYAALISFTNINDTPVISDTAFTMPENSINGTSVGTVNLTDPDLVDSHVFSIVGGNTGSGFAINAATGEITVNDVTALDFETNSVFTLTVRVQDLAGTFDTAIITINLTNIDEYDTTAILDLDAAPDTIDENSANGTVVGITAFADDLDQPDTITYSLDNNAGGRFTINAATGVVTVANSSLLNYENATSHNITIRATSTDASFSVRTFTINLTDVNETPVSVITDADAATNAVAENAANGSLVGYTASAFDADGTTNTVTYTLDNNAGGAFAIDSVSGIVTVADGSLLDRETAASQTIIVRATSADMSFATMSVDIAVIDVDEFDISPAADVNATANLVAEVSAQGTATGITVSAIDTDATTNLITYTLDDNAGGRFQIDAVTGVVTVGATSLDYEFATSYSITVRATSTDLSTTTLTLTINLTDVNEFSTTAIVDSNVAVNEVAENSASGMIVGITAFASDGDGTDLVSYSLDNNAGGRFTINSVTGVVTVADGTLLDREAAASHNIVVRATSTDSSFTTQTYTINLIDIDEFNTTPITDSNAAANAVNENAAIGTVVGIVASSFDADATTNTITYTLDDNAGGRFTINSVTGVVTVADGTLLDRETAGTHSIVVRATSADSSFQTLSFDIIISDIDEFDITVVADVDANADQVSENAGNGTIVGITAFASDADNTTNAVTYSLDNNAGGRFAVDSLTGIVTVADGTLLNRESAASHNVIVRATSADGSFSTQSYTINLIDVDEFDASPITDTNAALDRVNENAANGTIVGIVANSFDSDATTNTMTYTLDDNAGGCFSIDSDTGVVTVANGSLLDYETANSRNITVRATSADASTTTRTFTIGLNDLNDTPPAITPGQQFNVSEFATVGTVVGNVLATDADGIGTLQNWTITSGNVDNVFSINAATGQITVIDITRLNFESASSYTLTLSVSDGNATSALQTITIRIVDQNEAPILDLTSVLSVNENATNGTIVGTITGIDVDAGDVLRYSILSSGPVAPFNIDAITGQIRVLDSSLLNFEAVTSVNLTIEIRDASGLTDTQIVNIGLNNLNEAPIDIVLMGASVQENSAGGTFVGTFLGTDPDTGDSLTFSLINSAGGRFAIDTATQTLRIANGSSLNFEVSPHHVITVRTTDTAGHFYDESFTITIVDINDAPVAVADHYVTTQMTAVHTTSINGVLTNDYDEDGSPLSVIVLTGPTDGTLTMSSDGTFHYMPTNVFTGTDTFSYRVTDGQFNSLIVTVTIDVQQTISSGPGGSSGNGGTTGSGNNSGSNGGGSANTGTATGGSSTGGTTSNGGSTAGNGTNGSAPDPTVPATVAASGDVQGLGTETIFAAVEESTHDSRVDQMNDDAQRVSELASLMISSLTREYQQSVTAERRSGLINAGTAARFATSLFGGTVAVVPTDAIVSFSHFVFDQSTNEEQQTNTHETEITSEKIVVGSTAVVSTSISVGYVIWILRGGSLLTAFVSALPTWSSFDPLPVLKSFDQHNDDEDDTFLTIATRKAVKAVIKVVK